MFLHNSFDVLKAVIQSGSFTKAAQMLDMSGAAVGKHIQTLEKKLNMRLFHRTTRTLTPTEAALTLYDAVMQSSEYLNETLESLSDQQSAPTGRLRINVPMSYGELFLAAPIAAFAARYPDVIVDADFDDKRVHLIEEGYDLVVRIGALEDSGLIAKRISSFPILMCAAPDFLAQKGHPKNPEDITSWPMVCYSNAPNPALWSFSDKAGRSHSLNLPATLYANSASMMKEACLAGVGVALLPQFCCEKEIKTGQLIHILPDYKVMPERGVYVIYPDKNFIPLKVRMFIDMLQEHYKKGEA
ncbi:MAG: LysR family transcriptional regulator [Candidatus Puniceispirillaceae bacterium]